MQKKWNENDFNYLEFIAKGRISSVYKAVEIVSNHIVALKVIPKRAIDPLTYTQLRREIEIHSHLNHQYIINMYGYFETDDKIFLVLEFAQNGNLYCYLNQYSINEKEAAHIINQLLAALDYLKKRYVIHRDIKLENILLNDNINQIKLADFGEAVHSINKKRTTICGTLECNNYLN